MGVKQFKTRSVAHYPNQWFAEHIDFDSTKVDSVYQFSEEDSTACVSGSVCEADAELQEEAIQMLQTSDNLDHCS